MRCWNKINLLLILLLPLSLLFWLLSTAKKVVKSPFAYDSKLPTICVGNITVGGSGKTPVVISIIELLKKKNKKVAVLTRGYKAELSSAKTVIKVRASHSASQVGDEPLMIFEKTGANVYLCSNRALSAKQAETDGCDVIIMDDGMQNYTIKKDLIISVFNGKDGVKNGLLLPAGPLRETVNSGKNTSNLSIVIGEDKTKLFEKFDTIKADLIVSNYEQYSAKEVASASHPIVKKLAEKKIDKASQYIAFAGIGNPDKFFKSLEKEGIKTIEELEFPDHYAYRTEDLERILLLAKQENCKIITTEKDFVKIPTKYRRQIATLPVEITYSAPALKKLEKLLYSAILKKNK